MSAPFVNADMSPEDRVWEPREVSLPHWVWECVDELVEHHSGHSVECNRRSLDLALASFVIKALSLEQPGEAEYIYTTRAWWEGQLDVMKAATVNRPLTDVDEYMRVRMLVVEQAHDVVSQASDKLVASMVAELMFQVLYSRGVRLTLNEDLHTVMVGAVTPEQTGRVLEAAERLGIVDQMRGDDEED